MRRGILLLSVLLLTSSLAASYTVRTGDTLYSIAQRFGTTPVELQRSNGLTN